MHVQHECVCWQVCVGVLLIFLRTSFWNRLCVLCGLHDETQPAVIHYVKGHLNVGWRAVLDILMMGTLERRERSVKEFKEDFKRPPGWLLQTSAGDIVCGSQALWRMLTLMPPIRVWSRGFSAIATPSIDDKPCGTSERKQGALSLRSFPN